MWAEIKTTRAGKLIFPGAPGEGGFMKIGDRVVMNDKYRVSEINKGKVFVVSSEPWNVCGTECVLLEGYRGGYAVDGLTVVD